VKLARFLAHLDAIAGPVLATARGRVAAELIVGFSDGVSLIDGGHDLSSGVIFAIESRTVCSSSAFLAPFLPSARNSAARCFIAARSAAVKPPDPVWELFAGMATPCLRFLSARRDTGQLNEG
jgi:hypothetical protein